MKTNAIRDVLVLQGWLYQVQHWGNVKPTLGSARFITFISPTHLWGITMHCFLVFSLSLVFISAWVHSNWPTNSKSQGDQWSEEGGYCKKITQHQTGILRWMGCYYHVIIVLLSQKGTFSLLTAWHCDSWDTKFAPLLLLSLSYTHTSKHTHFCV